MMRHEVRAGIWAAVAGCLVTAVGLGQQPAFEAASVKAVNLASHPTFGNSGGPGTSDPGRIHLCCVGMYSLLMRAYDVEIDQIAGPAWIMDNMGPNLYQVDATMPPGTTKARFMLMMQSLLSERFHVQVHREKRNFPGYDLVVARDGPKLKEAAAEPNGGVRDKPQMLTSLGRGMIRVQAQEKTIGDLVAGMGRLIAQSMGADAGDFASQKPRVVDKTGLTGRYNFTLEFACDGCYSLGANLPLAARAEGESTSGAGPGGSGLPSIFAAIEKQLGLKLVKAKDIPLDIIVIDRVDKIPTGN